MWNIAHRGASGEAPENTMAAFCRAVEIGARHIETDLRLTGDGGVVAMHDSLLTRTTRLAKRIDSVTLRDLRKLSAGAWFAPPGRKFRRERVPTLQEILRFGGTQHVGLYLELKTLPDRGLEDAVVRAIHAAKASKRVVVISFHESALRRVKELDPAIPIGLLDKKVPREVLLRALALGAGQVLARAEQLTPRLIGDIREGGVKVIAWTVNEPRRMSELIRAGVDGIITDYPNRLEKVIREFETVKKQRRN